MGGRINRGRATSKSSKINSSHNQDILNAAEPNVSFSFKYFKVDEEFHIDHEKEYFQKVIYRLRDLCGNTRSQLLSNRSSALRCHPIDWSDNRVSRVGFDIPNEEDLCAETYQVSVSGNEYGRLIGFFTESATFNLVWFDREHKLYPGDL